MRCSLFLAAVVLAACTRLTTSPLPGQPIDESFRLHPIRWTSGEQIVFAYKIFNSGGKVAMCGAWAESPGGDTNQGRFNDWLVQTASLTVGDETIANDVGFFAKGRYAGNAAPVTTSNCRQTDTVWQPVHGARLPRLEFARSSFRLYD